jgi:signal transduction histidine kinase
LAIAAQGTEQDTVDAAVDPDDARAITSDGADFCDLMSDLVGGFERRTGIRTALVVSRSWPAAAPPGITVNLYRIAREALQNAARHSRAKHVSVKLGSLASGKLSMTVTDYGCGFDRSATTVGMGTIEMTERAVLMGGDLWIDTFPGFGTSVHVRVPR